MFLTDGGNVGLDGECWVVERSKFSGRKKVSGSDVYVTASADPTLRGLACTSRLSNGSGSSCGSELWFLGGLLAGLPLIPSLPLIIVPRLEVLIGSSAFPALIPGIILVVAESLIVLLF